MGRNPSYGLSPVSAGGQWTETARTNIDSESTTAVTFQSVFTAGQLYRIRGYNIAASTTAVDFDARMMDGATELSTTGAYLRENDGRGLIESSLGVVTAGSGGSANEWNMTGLTSASDDLIERSSRDMLGLCFQLHLFIGPTPSTDDVIVAMFGDLWGGFQDATIDTIGTANVNFAAYLPRTTPPDGIKFFVASDSFDFETGAYIAYDTIDSAFV